MDVSLPAKQPAICASSLLSQIHCNLPLVPKSSPRSGSGPSLPLPLVSCHGVREFFRFLFFSLFPSSMLFDSPYIPLFLFLHMFKHVKCAINVALIFTSSFQQGLHKRRLGKQFSDAPEFFPRPTFWWGNAMVMLFLYLFTVYSANSGIFSM